MPATPRHRLNNPLRKLRLILGEDGKPVHQESFANHVGMSLATLRSIESGRRPFSEDCRMHIFLNLCARWDAQKKQWYVLDSEIPYQKEHVNLAQSLDPHEPYVDDYNVHRLIERVLTMFEACRTRTRAHRRGLLMFLFRQLKDAAESFHLRADLEPTEPVWTETRNPNVWGKPLAKGVVFWPVYPHAKHAISPHQEPGGIFDFRSWRSFRPDDYPGGRSDPKQDAMAQEAMADTEDVASENEILTGPIPDPNAKEQKNGSKIKVKKDGKISY